MSQIPNTDLDLHIPPKSPDITTLANSEGEIYKTPSFKEKLLAHESMADPNQMQLDTPISHLQHEILPPAMDTMGIIDPTKYIIKHIKEINLTEEDRNQMYTL